MEVVKHRTFADGRIQEVVHVEDGRIIMTSGVVLPGKYVLNRVGYGKDILVTTGALIINGETINSGFELTLDPKDKLVIVARMRSSYVRHYE